MRASGSVLILSRICAFIGALIGLAIAVTVTVNLVVDRNWIAAIYLSLLIALNVLVIIFNWISKTRFLPWINGGASLLTIFFIFLARFSLGVFFTPPALFLVAASILGFIADPSSWKGWYSRDSQSGLSISPTTEEKGLNVKLTDQLTFRERQVLLILMQGFNNQEIAQKLVISQNTVRHHVHQIIKKLRCSSRMQAALIARKEGLSEDLADSGSFPPSMIQN